MKRPLEEQVYGDLCHGPYCCSLLSHILRPVIINIMLPTFDIRYYRLFLKKDGEIPEFGNWNYEVWFKAPT